MLTDLIDINEEYYFLIDSSICDHVHIFSDIKNIDFYKANIVIYEKYFKFFNIHEIYEACIIEKIDNKFLCNVEIYKDNNTKILPKIFSSNSYNQYGLTKDPFESIIDIEEINYIGNIEDFDFETTKGYFMALKFKSKNDYAKFKILYK